MWGFKRFKIRRLTKKIKNLQLARVHNQPSEESLKKEIAFYHKLAEIYGSFCHSKRFPFAHEMVLECYRASSTIDDPVAQYLLGKHLLEEARFREDLQKNGVFANANNERCMKQRYEEGLAYILAAEKLNHIEAMRLHGLCYINGWGIEADKQTGFELIVESIDKENSWDKVPHIFAKLGLNKNEFFSMLTQIKSRKSS